MIPNLKIDSSVVFQPGQVGLQVQAVKGELDKVVQFVRVFNASKLIVEGHTDSDGDERQNQALSEQRAGMIRDFLIDNYEEITAEMVEAKGYGETQPDVNNDSPENKARNRRSRLSSGSKAVYGTRRCRGSIGSVDSFGSASSALADLSLSSC